MTMSGILSINMPAFLSCINYLSPIRYAIRSLGPYSLRPILFTCDEQQRLPDGSCTINTGYEVLDLYRLNVDPNPQLLALAACTVLYRVLAWGLLRWKRGFWKSGMGGKGKTLGGRVL
jgi:hypothetical protein